MQPQRLRKMTTSCSCALFKKKKKFKLLHQAFCFHGYASAFGKRLASSDRSSKQLDFPLFCFHLFCLVFFFFFLNYWLLNTWPISHKRGKPVHETQRPLAVSVCCLFVLSTLCLLHLKSPLLFRACLRVCSSPFGGLRRRCSRLNVAGP